VRPLFLGQPSLARDPVEIPDERHLEEHHRIDPRLAHLAGAPRSQLADERKIDCCCNAVQKMVSRNPLLQTDHMASVGSKLFLAQHGISGLLPLGSHTHLCYQHHCPPVDFGNSPHWTLAS